MSASFHMACIGDIEPSPGLGSRGGSRSKMQILSNQTLCWSIERQGLALAGAGDMAGPSSSDDDNGTQCMVCLDNLIKMKDDGPIWQCCEGLPQHLITHPGGCPARRLSHALRGAQDTQRATVAIGGWVGRPQDAQHAASRWAVSETDRSRSFAQVSTNEAGSSTRRTPQPRLLKQLAPLIQLVLPM